jgi:heme exporter protein A
MQLVARELRCSRGGREVFHNINFKLRAGELLAVQGPNGAGKSSLLRLVGGLLPITAGRLLLEGSDPNLTLAEQCHYVGHQDAVKPSLTVRENLSFWARYLGEGVSRETEALEQFGLDALAELPAACLSAGQRRRVSLARLTAAKRPLWLLDEPTTSLDVAAQAQLAALMQAHMAGGGLIVVATHGPLGVPASHELLLGPPRQVSSVTYSEAAPWPH